MSGQTDVGALALHNYLRERSGTITRINAKSGSLLWEGEQWRVSPRLLRKIIDLQGLQARAAMRRP